MPKSKAAEKKVEKDAVVKPEENEAEKIIEIAEGDDALEDELIPGELEDEELDEDELGLDEEEVDPFKDKWEE